MLCKAPRRVTRVTRAEAEKGAGDCTVDDVSEDEGDAVVPAQVFRASLATRRHGALCALAQGGRRIQAARTKRWCLSHKAPSFGLCPSLSLPSSLLSSPFLPGPACLFLSKAPFSCVAILHYTHLPTIRCVSLFLIFGCGRACRPQWPCAHLLSFSAPHWTPALGGPSCFLVHFARSLYRFSLVAIPRSNRHRSC